MRVPDMVDTVVGIVGAAALTAVGFVVTLGNRVSVLESKYEAIERWLDRVESKLDRVIEGK